ncbi:MAG TPA: YceI family protein [Candidatus Limnocylindrales bacterium]|nr:YceI family protein [Candidatus Limnocylindrales bacterium]
MRVSRLILAVIAALVIIGVIGVVWFITTSGSGEASQPITAPTLEISAQPTAEGTQIVEAPVGEPVLFSLVPGESSASFTLNEELMGRPTTVVGTTTDVAGQIAVHFDQPAASQLGVIRFNLRTLATDNDFRNRALRGEILQSAQDEFEFGEFTPTALSGLPTAPIEPGQPISFEVTGDLTLKGVSNPATFSVTLSQVEADRLVGEATASVDRTDWGLTIPDVPGVANVEEMVDLTLVFVAVPLDASAAPEATAAPEAASAPVVFNITPGDSTVSFELDEDLRGVRTTVVGTTPDVAGQIAVDFSNPAASQAGVIRFNLRTLATDNDFRNRALRGQILQSAQDEFEFGEFTPTALSGLPDTPVEVGQTINFELTGDLRIRDVSNPVTFAVTLTVVSADEITGEATATVNRNDWGLTIPDVPSVANVEEEVLLTIRFVAAPGA